MLAFPSIPTNETLDTLQKKKEFPKIAFCLNSRMFCSLVKESEKPFPL